jgi:hypothetical protein
LVFGTAAFSLPFPDAQESGFIDDEGVIFRPSPERPAAGAIHGAETAQLAELLRELRDFR